MNDRTNGMRGIWVGAVLLTGLGPVDPVGGQARANPSTRDSAGVLIVENEAPNLSASPLWSVESDPLLSVGVVAGDPAQQFFNVADAMRFPDGRILVMDSGAKELRFFDASGVHLGTTGQEGEGPGDYQWMTWIGFYLGDSIAVYDQGLGRVSVLGPEGSYARSIRVSQGGGGVRMGPPGENTATRFEVLGAFNDGSFLARIPGPPYTSADSTHVARQSVRYVRLDREGAPIGSFGEFPGSEIYVHSTDGGVSVGNLPFGRSSAWIPVDDGLVFGANEGFAFDVVGGEGRIERSVRVDESARPLDPSVTESHRNEQLEQLDSDFLRMLREDQIQATPYPETLPYYTSILRDPSGHIWVERAPDPTQDAAEWTWYVFDGAGALLGFVRTPSGLDVTQVGDDFILGIREDDLGVESVAIHRLNRR